MEDPGLDRPMYFFLLISIILPTPDLVQETSAGGQPERGVTTTLLLVLAG